MPGVLLGASGHILQPWDWAALLGQVHRSKALRAIARRLDVDPAALALRWVLYHADAVVFKSNKEEHIRASAGVLGMGDLSMDDLAALDV